MSIRKSGILISVLSTLLLLVPAASAQVSPIMPGTITVFGEGSASVPAEGATVAIIIGSDSNIYFEDPMTMQDGPIDAMPTASVNVDAVLDAIVEFGIPVNDVTLIESAFMGEWGSGMGEQPASIMVTITDPTVEQLSDLLDVVRSAAHAEGLYVNQFGVMYSVADCQPLRQQARANAFQHAQAEAEAQADAMNVTLGDAIASRDTYPMNAGYFQTNSCNTTPIAVPYTTMYMAGQFDPNLPAEVTVFSAIEVSFEIP